MASRVSTPEWFRFCPVCVIEDHNDVGEIYWHRLHQLPGVLVCPGHNVFLEDSLARRNSSRDCLQFASAQDTIRNLPVRHLDPSSQDHHILLKLARDAAWLLDQPSRGTDLKVLHNRYLNALIHRRLATHTGSIYVSKLLDEFNKYCSPTLLKLLCCKFTGTDKVKTNWLLRLVRRPKNAQHSLYHLLLIQFLGFSVREFFQLPEQLNFFEAGPWPCLNAAATHFRELVIQECKCPRMIDGRPTGTFICNCGFSYVKSGPYSLPEDRFRAGRILSFGRIWEAKLTELWNDSSLSLSEVARRLGVNAQTVRRHADRLKLSFSSSGRTSKPLSTATQLKDASMLAAWQKRRSAYRSNWSSAVRQNPKITMKRLRQTLQREYFWLLKHDYEWLKRHRPTHKPQRRSWSRGGVDWKARDSHYAHVIKASVVRLKSALGRPERVTRPAIARDIGAATLFPSKLHKMPLTSQVLDNVLESREGYAVRRIRWATNLYRQESVIPPTVGIGVEGVRIQFKG
jgi:hypothetical protein